MLSKTRDQADKNNLQKWRDNVGAGVANYILNTASKIGQDTHQLNEDYLYMVKNHHDNFSLLAYAHHRNFIPYLNHISEVYGLEVQLFSDSMRLAGTADCVALYNGKLSIIDYKTKRSSQREEWVTDYFIQTAAYARMWKEATGNAIQQSVILVSSEQNTRQEFVVDPADYYDSLDERLLKYDSMR